MTYGSCPLHELHKHESNETHYIAHDPIARALSIGTSLVLSTAARVAYAGDSFHTT